jgi:hypothetical protein
MFREAFSKFNKREAKLSQTFSFKGSYDYASFSYYQYTAVQLVSS